MSAEFWDKQAERYEASVSKHESRLSEAISRTAAFLNLDDTILDYGCASGEISLGLAPHARNVHGIDISGEMIAFAQNKVAKRDAENVHFQKAVIFDTSLPAGGYDAVLAFNILHLIEDPSAALSRIHDLLRPGGKLISETPCLEEWGWFRRNLFRLVSRVGFIPNFHFFRAADLEALMSKKGFEIVESSLLDAKDAVQWIIARKQPEVNY